MNTRNRRAFSSASDFFEKYEAVGLYQSISNVLEHIGAFSPGRVEDILEACGAFDLGSSPSRDVAVFCLVQFVQMLCDVCICKNRQEFDPLCGFLPGLSLTVCC